MGPSANQCPAFLFIIKYHQFHAETVQFGLAFWHMRHVNEGRMKWELLLSEDKNLQPPLLAGCSFNALS